MEKTIVKRHTATYLAPENKLFDVELNARKFRKIVINKIQSQDECETIRWKMKIPLKSSPDLVEEAKIFLILRGKYKSLLIPHVK
jgi:hypothetical protein